jgi:antitoxin VapB
MITVPPDTEQLVRRVAAHTGKAAEEVLKEAVELEAFLVGVTVESARPRKDVDLDRVREITRRVSTRPLLDRRSPRQIVEDAWSRSE